MKTTLCLMLVLAAAGLVLAGCEEKPKTPAAAPAKPAPTDAGKTDAAAPAAAIAQKLCPVMGNPISPAIFVDHNGRRVYFCCGMCPDVFKKDPEKYLKIVDEQLKAAPAAPAADPHAGHKHG